MSGPLRAAALEEQAELKSLRDAADRSAADLAQTVAELTGRLATARQPKQAARWLAARARVAVPREFGAGWARTGGRSAVLVIVPVLVVVAAGYAATRRTRKNSNKKSHPERSQAYRYRSH